MGYNASAKIEIYLLSKGLKCLKNTNWVSRSQLLFYNLFRAEHLFQEGESSVILSVIRPMNELWTKKCQIVGQIKLNPGIYAHARRYFNYDEF